MKIFKRKLYVVLFLIVIISIFIYGFVVGRYQIFPYNLIKHISSSLKEKSVPMGLWKQARVISQAERLKKIATLPYLSGYKLAPDKLGITIYEEDLACNGLNLYTSGHAPEAILMDMRGKELYRWSYNFSEVWPEKELDILDKNTQHYWRRAMLFENGDLLAIYDYIGLIKINKASELLWSYGDGCHHDLFVTDNGNIYVITHKKKLIPHLNKNIPIIEDFITILDSKGKEVKSLSPLGIFEKSPFAYLMYNVSNVINKEYIDVFHTNTIEVFDGRLVQISPLFKKGNILTSFLQINTIAIIDPEKEEVVWAWGPNNIIRQHQPTLLDNGHILLFDNGLEFSRVLEIDPFRLEIIWKYGDYPKNEFFSETLGSNQYLPNGNILITDSTNGRAFEVTKDKRICWEWISPHRVGKQKELIATLCEMIRIDPEELQFIKKADNSF